MIRQLHGMTAVTANDGWLHCEIYEWPNTHPAAVISELNRRIERAVTSSTPEAFSIVGKNEEGRDFVEVYYAPTTPLAVTLLATGFSIGPHLAKASLSPAERHIAFTDTVGNIARTVIANRSLTDSTELPLYKLVEAGETGSTEAPPEEAQEEGTGQ